MNEVVARHLREARSELENQLRSIEDAIAMIDSMLGGVQPAPARRGLPEAPRGTGAQPSISEAIIEFMKSRAGDVVQTFEITSALEEEFGWSHASVRSQAAKLAKDGHLLSVRRGYYQLSNLHQTTEAAPARAASVNGTELAVPEKVEPFSQKEGGADESSVPLRGHPDSDDKPSLLSGDHAGNRASIMEVPY